ncbi:MAG: helicase-exonuclease AddAB subunit AddA [Lachnospiraceae bacterium]|nr:helicase-exonuclease AddAB subunit AddA [Lachnospiraceae bacterium]
MSEKSVNWTREQQQVIESRGRNLLVSAAAGSGKTAVLVERIIRMVTEGEHPLDIDKLLVMTFTNAAAAEMRERIGAAIEQRLQQSPENEHVQIQAALVHHAQITTIDSFCLHVIRNHFNLLDLDPSFRIGDEGELLLLRGDVMEELLEDHYCKDEAGFQQFVETYAQGKSDAGIDDYILQVYTFSQSNPYPDQWIEQCRAELLAGEHTAWMQFLMDDLRKQVQELRMQLADALEVCEQDEILNAYAPMLTQDARQLSGVEQAEEFQELYDRLNSVAWDRLATVRNKEVDLEKKAYVTGCRDRVKKAVGKMQELYCFEPPEEMFEDLAGTGAAVAVLLDLAQEFAVRFQEKKRERNLVDFNDLEHEALKVLIRLEEGKTVYTEAADELSHQFEEVLVDEYQDSNLVQEALLLAVSRERFGQHNVFMVGDVKQSIYKFRLARPELFLEKYETYEPYEAGDGSDKKIELHQNFRSRGQVLEAINDVFYQIMTQNLGNIRYTEETALHPGAGFPDEDGPERMAELLVVDTGSAALSQMEDEAADYTAKELEAKLIAGKIRQLTDPEQGLSVVDKKHSEQGGMRRAQYRDIVILLRSTTGWIETLLEVLMNEGIPAYAESRMGYFTTIEVETILSILSVIDNPMQDIPLAAVLKSPVVGMSDTELALMMAWYRARIAKGQDRGIYGAMRGLLDVEALEKETEAEAGAGALGAAGTDIGTDAGALVACRRRLLAFHEMLTEFRQQSTYLPIHELLYQIYERTGYYSYVSAMPAGETRKANLDMLVEKAASYEQTSYKGLFHFIRYIENLKKYNSDFGEAATVGEEDNTVRIMSIHKSKGLEFPIVFLAGMGKKFNRQDVYGRILIDPELGIGTDYLDLEHRLKTTTLKKNALRRKMELDNLGEELRVLYVAMTRAKEKLILTGTDRYLAKTFEKYAQVPLVNGQIPYTILSTAGSYLDWILMTLGSQKVRICVKEIPLTQIIGEELTHQIQHRSSKEKLLNFKADGENPARTQLLERLEFVYPHEADIRLHTKMSVSELKQQGQLLDEAESVRMEGAEAADAGASGRPAQGKQSVSPVRDRVAAPFAAVPGDNLGATRGTAYHRAMELLPFDQIERLEDVKRCLADMVAKQRFTQENYDLIDPAEIWTFLQSALGVRMRNAQREGRLHKEQQFVMGMPARQMGAADSDELVIIQGIIDAFFEEDGQLVLMDYKTDKVSKPEILMEHYKKQLDYYEHALTQMTGMRVREKIIYSLTLQQEILCCTEEQKEGTQL